jgi:hypothetical protein
MGYTNKAYPNMPRNWVPEELAAWRFDIYKAHIEKCLV